MRKWLRDPEETSTGAICEALLECYWQQNLAVLWCSKGQLDQSPRGKSPVMSANLPGRARGNPH